MWIQSEDLDRDGLVDNVYSDRKGGDAKFPLAQTSRSAISTVGAFIARGQDREVMFLGIAKVDKDGKHMIVCGTKHASMMLLRQDTEVNQPWRSIEVSYPPDIGTGKGVAIGDVDGDSVPDLVCTCENASG